MALYATFRFVPGLSIPAGTRGFVDALIGAVVLTLINLTVKPILLILTLPINLLTLGLFTFVIIGVSFWLMTWFTPGMSAAGFVPALIGALIFGFLNWILHLLFE